ncbi:WW domain binding protein 1-like [Aplysia californica]|uniref:WW domain binding protein 1-like n=1 Tax=Aplysia californica TaxID=6500 RepID=A0ABM0JJ95_APLCA|nr:WW domain binding protein 1-like [Aplysia californica]
MDVDNLSKIIFTLALAVPVVGSSIQCGDYVCHGHSPYCCTLDDGELGCCWDTFVYQLWWFWLIWVVVFFMILGCSLACWRRRRQHVRYVVMANSEYPSYGTVVHGASTHTAYQTGPMPPPPTAPAAPPSYANKPPPYSYSG